MLANYLPDREIMKRPKKRPTVRRHYTLLHELLASPTGHVQRIDAAPTAHNPFPASVRHRLQG